MTGSSSTFARRRRPVNRGDPGPAPDASGAGSGVKRCRAAGSIRDRTGPHISAIPRRDPRVSGYRPQAERPQCLGAAGARSPPPCPVGGVRVGAMPETGAAIGREAAGAALLLERDRELAALAQLVDGVAAGRAATAVVDGPAGIGKS